jgi:hypothetical protein
MLTKVKSIYDASSNCFSNRMISDKTLADQVLDLPVDAGYGCIRCDQGDQMSLWKIAQNVA